MAPFLLLFCQFAVEINDAAFNNETGWGLTHSEEPGKNKHYYTTIYNNDELYSPITLSGRPVKSYSSVDNMIRCQWQRAMCQNVKYGIIYAFLMPSLWFYNFLSSHYFGMVVVNPTMIPKISSLHYNDTGTMYYNDTMYCD